MILHSTHRSAFINITVNPELEGGPEMTYTGEKGAGFYVRVNCIAIYRYIFFEIYIADI